MKIKLLFAFAVCLFAFSVSKAQFEPNKMPLKVLPVLKENYASANSDEIFTVGKVTGDIGKAEALYLPKPFYPGEAKKDSAEGKIYVSIAIDEKGNVTSARSTDGHPALRKIAEETALISKFRAANVDNQPTKSEGWLVYNFEVARSNWIKTAYDLAILHSPFNSNPKLTLIGIKKNIKPDWTAENEMLTKLEEFVAQMPKIEKVDEPPILATKTIDRNGTPLKVQTFGMRLPVIPPPNPEQIAVAQNLVNALQSRLASDEIASWQFDLAFAILKESHPSRETGEYQPPQDLTNLLQNAPQNLSAEYKTELANLINLIETERMKTPKKNMDSPDNIRNSVIRLQKLK